jgi:hypothetical protein
MKDVGIPSFQTYSMPMRQKVTMPPTLYDALRIPLKPGSTLYPLPENGTMKSEDLDRMAIDSGFLTCLGGDCIWIITGQAVENPPADAGLYGQSFQPSPTSQDT